jgi:hypothetical protein
MAAVPLLSPQKAHPMRFRCEKSIAYAKAMQAARALQHSLNPEDREVVKSINASLKRIRDDAELVGAERAINPGDVHVNTLMGNLSVQYANEAFIGERLMPVINVGKLSNLFAKYDKRDILAYPSDEMADGAEANEVSQARSTGSYLCQGRGFKTKVLVKTIDNADEPYNEMLDATDQVNEGLAFKRELRIAAKMCTSANYGSNTTGLAGGARWDTATGNPVRDVLSAKSNMWMGRGKAKTVGFCSEAVYRSLKTNTLILDVLKYSRGGTAKHEELLNLFEIDELHVGAGRQDTANSGQAASYGRIWSDVFGIVRVAETPSLRNAVFGYTPRFKNEVQTKTWFNPHTDTRGAYWIQSTADEDHIIVAPDTGFLITTPIS